MKRSRLLPLAIVTLAALALPTTQLVAAPEALSDQELSDARGGVLVAGDLAFQFGAIVKTFENGQLALQTQLTWTPQGVVYEHVPGQNVTPLVSGELSQMAGKGGSFVTETGATVIHQVTEGQLVNMLLNTASDQTFRQETEITIVLPGFEAVQADIGANMLGLRLVDDLAFGSVIALQ